MKAQRSGAKKLYKAKKQWVTMGLATGALSLLALAPAVHPQAATGTEGIETAPTATAAVAPLSNTVRLTTGSQAQPAAATATTSPVAATTASATGERATSGEPAAAAPTAAAEAAAPTAAASTEAPVVANTTPETPATETATPAVQAPEAAAATPPEREPATATLSAEAPAAAVAVPINYYDQNGQLLGTSSYAGTQDQATSYDPTTDAATLDGLTAGSGWTVIATTQTTPTAAAAGSITVTLGVGEIHHYDASPDYVPGQKTGLAAATNSATDLLFDFDISAEDRAAFAAAGYYSTKDIAIVRDDDGNVDLAKSQKLHLAEITLPTKAGYHPVWYYQEDYDDFDSASTEFYHQTNIIPAHDATINTLNPANGRIQVRYIKDNQLVPVELKDAAGNIIKTVYVTVANQLTAHPESLTVHSPSPNGVTVTQTTVDTFTVTLAAPALAGYRIVGPTSQTLTLSTDYLKVADSSIVTNNPQLYADLAFGANKPAFTYAEQTITAKHTYVDQNGKELLPATTDQRLFAPVTAITDYGINPTLSTITIEGDGQTIVPPTDLMTVLAGLEPIIGDQDAAEFATQLIAEGQTALAEHGTASDDDAYNQQVNDLISTAQAVLANPTAENVLTMALTYFGFTDQPLLDALANADASAITITTKYVYQLNQRRVTTTHTYTDAAGNTILDATHESTVLPMAPRISGYELNPFKSTLTITGDGTDYYPANPSGKPETLGAIAVDFQEMMTADPDQAQLIVDAADYSLAELDASDPANAAEIAKLNGIKNAANAWLANPSPATLFNLAIGYYSIAGLPNFDAVISGIPAADVQVATHYVYDKVTMPQVDTGIHDQTKTVTYTINLAGTDHAPLVVTQTFTRRADDQSLVLWTPDVTLPDVPGTQHLNYLPAANIWADPTRLDFDYTVDYRPSEQTLLVSYVDEAGRKLQADRLINGVTGQVVHLDVPKIAGYTASRSEYQYDVTLAANDLTIQHEVITYRPNTQLDDGPRVRTQVTGGIYVTPEDFYDNTKPQPQLDDGPRVRTQVTGGIYVTPEGFYDNTKPQPQLDDGPRVRTQMTGGIYVTLEDFYDNTKPQPQLDDGPRVRTQMTGGIYVTLEDFYDNTKPQPQLDDGPRVRTQVTGGIYVTPEDFYDNTKPQPQLDDGPRVRTQMTGGIYVTPEDFYDNTKPQPQLDDGPRVRTQVTGGIYVTPEDFYDNTKPQPQLDGGPRVRTQVTGGIYVTPEDFYDNTKPQPQLDDGPRVRTQVTGGIYVTPEEFYDNTKPQPQLDDGPRVRTQVTGGIYVTPEDFYDNTKPQPQLDNGPRVRTQMTGGIYVTPEDFYDNTKPQPQLDDGPRVRTQVTGGIYVTPEDFYDNTKLQPENPDSDHVDPTTEQNQNPEPTITSLPLTGSKTTPRAVTQPLSRAVRATRTAATSLPQTGEHRNGALAALGVILLSGLLALGTSSRRRRTR
ncbi:LPXTG cell wall anchor domain-containing protein [Lacticaseibacillus suihuaensis]